MFSSSLWAVLAVLVAVAPGLAADPCLEMADELFARSEYDAAITEYHRFLCFHPDGPQRATVYQQIGLAHRCRGEFPEAVAAFRRASGNCAQDSLRDELAIQIALVLLHEGRTAEAQLELLPVFGRSVRSRCRERAALFLGVCYLQENRWTEAREVLTLALEGSDTAVELDSLLSPSQHPRLKSPRLAACLSTFIPGAGQIYAGDYWTGLNALALNGALAWLVLDTYWIAEQPATTIPSLLLFQRYYRGNLAHARGCAQSRNASRNQAYRERVLDAIGRGLAAGDAPLVDR